MRRMLIAVLVALLAGLVAAPPAIAQVAIRATGSLSSPGGGNHAEEHQTDDVAAPGSGSVSAAVGSAGSSVGSFAYAHAETSIGSSSISGYGYANAASNPPDHRGGGAISTLEFGFTFDCPTQVILSYELGAPIDDYLDQDEAGLQIDVTLSLRTILTPGQQFLLAQPGPGTNHVSGTSTFLFDPGGYQLRARAQVSTPSDEFGNYFQTDPSPPADSFWQFVLEFRDGKSQDNPLLPMGTGPNGGWLFTDVPRGLWYDPILADGFEFEMLDEGSLFTEAGMPVGLGDPNGYYIVNYFDGLTEVFVQVDEGENYIFPGAGVASFKVLDIGPPFDPDDPLAFPIYLDFSTPTASFTMTPILVPEPSSLALLSLGGVLALCRWRRTRN